MTIESGHQIKAEELVDVPSQKLLLGIFPRGTKGYPLTAQGAGANPAYAFPIGCSSDDMSDIVRLSGYISTTGWGTVFDIASPLILLCGIIRRQNDVTKYRFTIDGASPVEKTFQGGFEYSPLPPVIADTSLKLELYWTSGAATYYDLYYKLL